MAFSKVQEIETLIKAKGWSVPDSTLEATQETRDWIAACGVNKNGILEEQHIRRILQVTAAHALEVDALPDTDDAKTYLVPLAAFLNQADDAGRQRLRNILVRSTCDVIYSAMRPERYDLFNHMSACEMFFVDGDSLLMYALSNYNVNWDMLQSVHIMYIALRLLDDLASRGGVFQVVFFDSNEWIWSFSPQKRLIRAVLQCALQQRAEEPEAPFTVMRFANWWDEKFIQHVRDFEPEFMLLSDGHQIAADPAVVIEGTISKAAAVNSKNTITLFHAMLVQLLTLRVHVAYTSRLTQKDNAVVAFVARSFSVRFNQCEVIAAQVADAVKDITPAVEDMPAPLSDDENALADKLFDKELVSGMRETAVFLGLRFYVDSLVEADNLTPEQDALVATAMVATLTMRALDIKTRAQARGSSTKLSNFMSEMAKQVQRVAAFLLPDLDFDATVVDVLDGNLIFCVAYLLQQSESDLADLLGEDLADEAVAVWKFVRGKKNDLAAVDFNILPDDLEPGDAPAEFSGIPVEPAHPLLSFLTEQFKAQPYDRSTEHQGFGSAVHLQRKKWHMRTSLLRLDDPPEPQDQQPTAEAETMKEKRKSQRNKTKYLNTVRQTAESMEGVAFLFQTEGQCIVDEKAKAAEKKVESAHAKKAKEKAKEKGTLSKKDVMRRENTIRLANKTMLRAFNALRDNLRRDGVSHQMLDEFMKKLNLAKGKIGDDNEEDKESESDSDNEEEETKVEAGKLPSHIKAFRTFIGAQKEGDVLFKRSGDTFTGISAIEKFVDDQEKIFNKNKADAVLSEFGFEMKSKMQLVFIKMFESHLKFQILLKKLELNEGPWKKEKEAAHIEQRDANIMLAVDVFRAAHACYNHVQRSFIRVMDDQRNHIRAALRNLDFQDSYYNLVDREIERIEDPTGKDLLKLGALPSSLLPSRKLLEHTASRFQLNNMGHLMERHVMNTKDGRVPFNPDDWQRELLDIVDRRGSAVVCAPTSAGKTFISYYCMKKVLRESNNDMVVYIAPNRALVNQAVADVYARFGKKEYKDPGVNVFGVLGGRDFVQGKPFNCQVLVTLPEVLESLLMSPDYLEWSRRIKYIIFDEIHSIDNFGNGAVWERLLMMVRAPFVALSATLGDTDELVGWLNRVQKKQAEQFARENPGKEAEQDYSVALVPSGGRKIQRWSDIQKYAFLPNENAKPFTKLTDKITQDNIVPVHPLSCVTIEMLRSKYPQDLPLVPKESVQLFEHMWALSADIRTRFATVPAISELAVRLAMLNPDRYFSADRSITQRRAREYETELRMELMKWGKMTLLRFWKSQAGLEKAARNELHAEFDSMVQKLLAGASHAVEAGEALLTKLAYEKPEEIAHPDTFQFVQRNILPALQQLKAKNLLPAIVFSFEQDDCETLAETVIEQLEAAEAAYRETEEFAKYEAMMKGKEELQRRAKQTRESQLKAARTTRDEDGKVQEVEKDHIDIDENADYSIPDVLPEFTFVPSASAVDRATLDEILFSVRHIPLLKRAVERGVGIHHPGVSGKHRGFMEKLFRQKHLPVVFATETLALGIHSPCRSVVLAGDHVLLNTMQFRQMSGRAGRRGMDFLGHVIFMGISSRKMRRLLTSNLMVLKGHVQVDPMFQLRLLQLFDYHNENEKLSDFKRRETERECQNMAKNIAECLFVEPLFAQGRAVCNVTTAEDEAGGVDAYNFETFQVMHFRRLLPGYFQQGLHYNNNGPEKMPATLGNLVTRSLNTYNAVDMQAAAFVFAALLASKDSVLHDLDDTALMDVMAYIFTRDGTLNLPLEIHPSVLSDPAILSTTGKMHSGSMNNLEDVHPDVAAALEAHNATTLMLATQVAVDQGMQLSDDVDRQLPIAFKYRDEKKNKIKERAIFPKDLDKSVPLAKQLKAQRFKTFARSPFVAIAGLGDVFDSVEDLSFSARSNVFFDQSHVPTIDFVDLHAHHRAKWLTNAAVMDFDRCESQQVEGRGYRRIWLEKFNGLNASASYAVLNKFFTAVTNITEAMLDIRPDEQDDITADAFIVSLSALHRRCKELHRQVKNRKDTEEEEEELLLTAAAPAPGTAAPAATPAAPAK